jgi:hypothetical protein
MKKIPAYWRNADQMPLALRYTEVVVLLTNRPYAEVYSRDWATYAVEKGETVP